MLKSCKCPNKYQDEKYGKGQRVFNPSTVRDEATCTSCGTTQFHARDKK